MGAEEAGAAPDGGADAPLLVRRHQVPGDLSARLPVGTGSSIGQILNDRTIHRTIGVEVVPEDQLRLRGSRPLDDGRHQWRMELAPAMVWRACTRVAALRAGAAAPPASFASKVGRRDFNAVRQIPAAAPTHGTDPLTSRRQLSSDGEPEWACSQDDTEGRRLIHGRSTLAIGQAAVASSLIAASGALISGIEYEDLSRFPPIVRLRAAGMAVPSQR